MYERFYDLAERPFDMVPNPRYLYVGARHLEVLSSLQYGLTTPRGLMLLLGDAGTGKTTLVHAALADLLGSRLRVVLLSNPTLTRAEFYEYLAEAFGLGAGAAGSKTRFLLEVRRKLERRASAGVMTALIIDEAQSAPHELLEEVRLISNIETLTQKLLNVVLSGQPELADRLNDPSLRQLKQRISLRCELLPMTLQETASYIAGRVRIAGGNPASVFTREAAGGIHRASKGLPRIINVICDNALLSGFALNVRPVSARVVREVCRDLDIDPAGESPGPGRERLDPVDLEPAAETAEMFGMFGRKRRFSLF